MTPCVRDRRQCGTGRPCASDYSRAPDAHVGPINCPIASTVSASRIAITMLGQAAARLPTRATSARSRSSPARLDVPPRAALAVLPVRMAGHAGNRGRLRRGLEGDARGGAGCSGGDICALVWWGMREETGEPWADGSPHPVGQGAHVNGDGRAASSTTARLRRDSPHRGLGGPQPVAPGEDRTGPRLVRPRQAPRGTRSRHALSPTRGCLCDRRRRAHEEPALGLEGGLPARANSGVLNYTDGTSEPVAKATRLHVPKGATLVLNNGGGGGYGPPAERDPRRFTRTCARATSPKSTPASITRTRSNVGEKLTLLPHGPLIATGRERTRLPQLVLIGAITR